MPRLITVLGSVTPPGRSLKALEGVIDCAKQIAPGSGSQLLNLRDYRLSFADGRAPDDFGDDTGKVVGLINDADAVILASPVYRGSISGSLKNLLDQLPIDALRAKPCGIVAIGATDHHFLGVDWHLRDVLAWFGALIAPTSVYLSSADFKDGEPSDSAKSNLRELTTTVLELAKAVSPRTLGPAPLAARRNQ